MTVCVTGAYGFVGRALTARLAVDGRPLVRAVRTAAHPADVAVGSISAATDWQHALRGCRAVAHLAARVHVMQDSARDPLAEFRAVNTAATLNLARQAAAEGISRFVYVSTVKVHGERGHFTDADTPEPQDDYAVSKWEAEAGLREIARDTGMQVVVLRPPLVYGPGVGANFCRLMRAIDRRMPLPLALVRNRRSLVYVGNLADAIAACLTHPAASGHSYLVSDGEDVSTPDLIRRLGQALQRKPLLLPVPPGFMRVAGLLTGKSQEVDRLLGSLTVDGRGLRRDLGWSPPFTLGGGLEATAHWYRQQDAAA
jgi:UDP-glucose 4-epimerase